MQQIVRNDAQAGREGEGWEETTENGRYAALMPTSGFHLVAHSSNIVCSPFRRRHGGCSAWATQPFQLAMRWASRSEKAPVCPDNARYGKKGKCVGSQTEQPNERNTKANATTEARQHSRPEADTYSGLCARRGAMFRIEAGNGDPRQGWKRCCR